MFAEGSRCCSLEDVRRARRVCEHLGIRHEVLRVVEEFRERIILPFVEAYARGRTPNPCIDCNLHFKFGAMLQRARELHCDALATGHYVRVADSAEGPRLLAGTDAAKDQSYFLHRLRRDQLVRAVFPLGGLTKAEVRAYVAARGLPVQGAPESSDLCFLTPAGPGVFVEKYRPELCRPGPILDGAGRVVGRHAGFHRFTIGQRSGLGVALGERIYLRELRPDANAVVVGPREEVLARRCDVHEMFWQSPVPPADGDTVGVKVRYRTAAVPARIEQTGPDRLRLHFAAPVFALTPGQAAVLYRGDEVLGGGWIA
jgi:tRNA-specific 2-thiouridylase